MLCCKEGYLVNITFITMKQCGIMFISMKMNELTPEMRLLLYVSKNILNINYIFDMDNDLASECDPDTFYRLAGQNGLLNVAYSKLKHIKSFNLPNHVAMHMLQKTDINKKLSILYDIFCDCNHKNVCVGKGFSFAQYIYNDLYLRSFSDIDIYVLDTNISSFCTHLLKKGYKFAFTEGVEKLHGYGIDNDATFQISREKIFYKNGQVIEVKTLPWDLSYIAYLIEDTDKKINDYIHNSDIPLMPEALNIVFLIAKTHNNFGIYGMCMQPSLRDFADFYSFLKKSDATRKLNEVANKYGLQKRCNEILLGLYELYEDESIFEGIDFFDVNISLSGIFPEGNSVFDMIEGNNNFLEKYLHNSVSRMLYSQEEPATDELLKFYFRMIEYEYIYSEMNSTVKFLNKSNYIKFLLMESTTRVTFLFKRSIDFMDLSFIIEISILKCFNQQILADNYRTIRLILTSNDITISPSCIDKIQTDMFTVNNEQIFRVSFLKSNMKVMRTKDGTKCIQFYIEIFPEDLKVKMIPWFYLGSDFVPLRCVLQDFSSNYVWNNVNDLIEI